MLKSRQYAVYRGLQRPLVLYMFKGKYIYIGLATIFLGLICTFIVLATAGFLWAILTLALITGGGLTYTARGQSQGLHSKTKNEGVYVLEANIKQYGTKIKKL